MKNRLQYVPGIILLLLAAAPLSSQVTVPHAFQSGQPARAAEVNANFEALRSAVEALQGSVTALQANVSQLNATVASAQSGVASIHAGLSGVQSDVTAAQGAIATLETAVAAIEGSEVMALEDYVAVVDLHGHATVRFSGVNVQIVNGVAQETLNGRGNLIVGYNNPRTQGWPDCSDVAFDDELSCTTAGALWSVNHKSGSHNLVVGDRNAYSQTGGIVAGYNNVISGPYATITGGHEALARGFASSVSGGGFHYVAGDFSSVSGGYNNGTSAANLYGSVLGGRDNGVTGDHAAVLGGRENIAQGAQSTVLGTVGVTNINDDTVAP